MNKHIKCADCRFTAVDKSASEYTRKHCKDCAFDSGCTCRKYECKCGGGCELKATDAICSMQEIKWPAVQCTCPDSEYHRSLLNITQSGDMLEDIIWSGCACGERRCG